MTMHPAQLATPAEHLGLEMHRQTSQFGRKTVRFSPYVTLPMKMEAD